MKKSNFALFLFSVLLISSCSVFKKTTTVQPPIQPPKVPEFFTVTPQTTTSSDSVVTLKWQMNSDSLFLNGVPYNDSSGNLTFVLDSTTNFELTVIKNGNKISYKKTVTHIPTVKKPKITVQKTNHRDNHIYSTGDYDGRFTLGTVSGYRLMYGFPSPRSTSHFVFTVNDCYASNSPNLHNTDTNIIYFQGDFQSSKNKYNGNNKTEVLFMLDSVNVMQTIQPVNDQLIPVNQGEQAHFMHITYKVTNNSDNSKIIGLMALMDIMIGDNDKAYTYFNNNKITRETTFGPGNIPKKFKNLKTEGRFDELHATTLFTDQDLLVLDTLAIGNWPHFNKTVWNINPSNKTIGDIAYLLKWNKQNLSVNDSIIFSYYIGIETEPIVLLYNEKNLKSKTITLNYTQLGQTNLSAQGIDSLKTFIASVEYSKISSISVDGYADAYGSNLSNQKISLKRANTAKQILINNNISSNLITIKSNGENYSDQNPIFVQKGKQADRKIKVTIFYND